MGLKRQVTNLLIVVTLNSLLPQSSNPNILVPLYNTAI